MFHEKELAKIRVVFENCESITVPVKDVRYFMANKISYNYRVNNLLKKDKHRMEYDKSAEYFQLIITNKPEYDRILEHTDITQIHMYNEEEEHEWFFVPWGNDQYNNEYQTTQVKKDEIQIVISQSKK